MRLTRFKVENHRRLADLDIEVRDHLVRQSLRQLVSK